MTKQALIIVDIQNDYFTGGKWTLHNIESVAANSAEILNSFRKREKPVFHVQHINETKTAPFFVEGSNGADIHPSAAPLDDEPLFVKSTVNPFASTNLLEALKQQSIEEVVIVGAMSHMCIDATARSAVDYGFKTVVIEDASASKDVEFNGQVVPAEQVHNAFMAPLAFAYADVTTTNAFLNGE